MIRLPINKIATVVEGELHPANFSSGQLISSISIDSRTLVDAGSCLFFALVGGRHNGHKYIDELYQKGVRGFVVSEYQKRDQSAFPEARFICVEDSLKALHKLAAFLRSEFQFPVLSITGSNGKTMVKEWLFDLLQHQVKIGRSPKSYNSQVGVPLSIWNMAGDFDLGILEAGISKPGEMEKLAAIIRPELALITNIGDAHQENFQSLEEKVTEKLKLFEGADLLVYRKDQELVSSLVERKFRNASTNLFSWTINNSPANLQIELKQESQNTRMLFRWKGEDKEVKIPFSDKASIENACHCLAFIVARDWLDETVIEAFLNLQPVAMRLELKQGINNCILINDFYNSDINSLEIALQFLGQQSGSTGQKKTVILSDIKQSGFSANELYSEVNRLFQLNQVRRLIGIGKAIRENQPVFQLDAEFYEDTQAFLASFDPLAFQNETLLIKGAREFRFERIAALLQKKYHQTLLEINLNTLVENLNVFKGLLKPDTRIMIMVKAFSYGSGTVEIARALEFQKVDYLAVAVADEGIELRQAGIGTPIVVMNPEEHSFEAMIEYQLEPNIYSMQVFQQFRDAARSSAVNHYPIHLKLETGMNRLGFADEKELIQLAEQIQYEDILRVQSVFSHLAASDDPAYDLFTREQCKRFIRLSDLLISKQNNHVIRHLMNSSGIERFPDLQLEMVRLGIGLYGVAVTTQVNVRPFARWTTAVSQVKVVEPGETVGYGRKGQVEQRKEIAVVPVGYADGYDRRFGNGVGKMWVNGMLAPVIGNVCMDMTMIDVTGLGVEAGDLVELMGEHVTLNDLAHWAETIPYEILTGISQRVKRVYTQE